MNTENDIDLVEKYFDNELTESELQYFNERIETDSKFKTLYDNEVNLHKAIHLQGLQHDLQYLKTVEGKLDNETQDRHTRSLKPWVYYAAAAAIAFIALAIWIIPTGNEPPDKLFHAYYKTYPNVFEPTLRGSELTTNRTEAFHAYDRGDYEKAATLFKQLLAEKQEPGILLLLSNVNLNLGNTAEAKANLLTLLNNYDDLDIQAKWYLSLCYMKEGDIKNAKKLLQELNKTEVSYAAKAKDLLKKVE